MKIDIKERKLTEGKRALYLEYYKTGFRKRENLQECQKRRTRQRLDLATMVR